MLVEATASGTPVISSRCQWGAEEVLAGRKYGLLYDAGNVDQLAGGIRMILGDHALARRFAELGRPRAEDFDEAHIATARGVLPRAGRPAVAQVA